MSGATCAHEANVLLIGLLNGSLADEERSLVRSHLATCAACREELALLSGLAMAVARHGVPREDRPRVRPEERTDPPVAAPLLTARSGRAVAAVLLVPVLLGVWWLVSSLRVPEVSGKRDGISLRTTAPPAGAGQAEPNEAAKPSTRALRPNLLDLGAGPLRDGPSPPSFTIEEDAGEVLLSVVVPGRAQLPMDVELRTPEGKSYPLATLRRVDPVGRWTGSLPSVLLGRPGRYELVFVEREPGNREPRASARVHHFPFTIKAASIDGTPTR